MNAMKIKRLQELEVLKENKVGHKAQNLDNLFYSGCEHNFKSKTYSRFHTNIL